MDHGAGGAPAPCCLLFLPKRNVACCPAFSPRRPNLTYPRAKVVAASFLPLSLCGARTRAKNSRTTTYKSPPTQRKRHQFTNSSVKRRSQKETNYPPPSTHLSTHTFKMKVRENPCFVGDFNAREILPALVFFITVPCLLRFVLAPCY